MADVPIIDINKHRQQGLTTTELNELAIACEDHGFFLLSGHGLDDLIARAFEQAKYFSALSRAKKLSCLRSERNPLGYYDRELTKQVRDHKEVFDFRPEAYGPIKTKTRTPWPEGEDEFKTVLAEWFGAFSVLSEEVMKLVFTALGMPEVEVAETMQICFERHASTARLNYYYDLPFDPVPENERQSLNQYGDMALQHHTDPGAITLLLQDNYGGLQTRSKTKGWIDVPPQDGCIVVNVGDALQVWTNDRCTAALHRVQPVHSPEGRYSIPYFYQPKLDAMLEPWLTDQPHYRPFTYRELIMGRVNDNYADYEVEDIQIAKYKMA
ncbi:MAG: 2OG-Fe(II) oxygenase family protein [Pseudomonadota bacterium]